MDNSINNLFFWVNSIEQNLKGASTYLELISKTNIKIDYIFSFYQFQISNELTYLINGQQKVWNIWYKSIGQQTLITCTFIPIVGQISPLRFDNCS